ncbi:MAG: fibronectin type III domain-containing protein [Bacteroidota bacterium]
MLAVGAQGQTAQSLPYSDNFSTILTGGSTTYPAGWQGYTLGASPFANAAAAVSAGAGSTITLTAGGNANSATGAVYNATQKLMMVTSGSVVPGIVLAVNTTGKTNVVLTYTAGTIRDPANRINGISVQYRVGTSGSFTALTTSPSAAYVNTGVSLTGTGTTMRDQTTYTATLPVAAENVAVVQIRWVPYDVSGSGSRPGFGLSSISVTYPVISTSGTLSALSTTYGTASANTSFTVSGTTIQTGGITATAPSGFEVSTSSSSGFGSTCNISSTGTVNATTIYVRLAAATPQGTYSGNVVLSSTGATSVNVATASSTVSQKNLTITGITANNKAFDGNTTATLSGTAALSGVLAGEIANVSLSGTPTAVFADATIGNGKTITVSGYTLTGSASGNYSLTQPTGLTANITSAGCAAPALAMQVTPVSSIATTSASLNANISSIGGGANITIRGFEFGTSSSLTSPTVVSQTGTYTTGNYSLSTGAVLSANTIYYYRGYATNDCGTPQTSYTATSSYPSFTTVAGAPTSPNATSVANTSFTANWTAPAGTGTITGYKLDVATDGAFSSILASYNDLSVASTSQSVSTGIASSTTYYFRVRAVNAGGTSVSSSTCTLTTTTPIIAPTTQASNVAFGSIAETGFTISWTNGNGGNRVVILNNANSFTTPADGTSPSASTAYSGSGQQVVYNGTGTSVAITGLTGSTAYWARVYEYNGTGGTTVYQSATATNNPNSQTTSAPPSVPQPTNLTFSSIKSYTFNATFTAASGVTGYLVLWRRGASPTSAPTDGSTYTTGDMIGNGKVIQSSSATTFTVKGLSAGFTYYFDIYSYSGSGGSRDYNTVSPLENSQITTSTGVGSYYGSLDLTTSGTISALKTLVSSGFTSISYDNYKTTMISEFASRDTTGGTKVFTCVYSGEQEQYTPPFAFAGTTSETSREHTWCHSWMNSYNSESGDEYTDQHHLFPVNQNQANAVRNNYPLDVVSSVTSTFGGAKYGRNSSNVICYEPRANHKGDAARALMYMSLRYDGVSGHWYIPANTAGGQNDQNGQDFAVLKTWHNADPPDGWEIARNDYIYSLQGNRNPFVDHPEWVDYIDFSDLTPTYVQATTVTFSNIGYGSFTTNWTNGNGARRIVKINTSNSFTTPTNGVNPVANSVYSSGEQIVYSGTGSSAAITGLTAGTTYYVRVYEYNGTGASVAYHTVIGSGNPASQVTLSAPVTQALNVNFSSVTGSAFTIGWTNGNGSGRIVKLNTSNSFTSPINGTDPSANSAFGGSEQVVYNGTGSSVAITGLSANTTYYARVYEYNGSSTGIIFNTATATNNPNSQATPVVIFAPTTQATNVSFASVTDAGFTINWTSGNGANRVVILNTANTFTTPADGTSPTANTVYSSGQQVIYNGAGTGVSVTGLLAGTNYYARVYEYNGTGAATLFYSPTALNNPGNQSSAPVIAPSTQPAISFSAVTANSFTINFTGGNGSNRAVYLNTSGSFTNPSDGVAAGSGNAAYTSGTQLVYNGSGTSVAVTGLSYTTTYTARVFEYNGSSTANLKYAIGTVANNPNTQATNNPSPTISSISPNSKTTGDADFTLTVTGTNFYSGSVVRIGGSDRVTTYVSPTSVTAAILASDVAAAGTPSITVFNAAPGGGTSGGSTLTVSAPAPVSLVYFDTYGQTSYGTSPLTASTINSNLTVVAGLSRSAGITTASGAAGNAWGGYDWDGSTENAYFSVKANTGYEVSYTNLKFYGRRSSGTSAGTLSFSTDNGSSWTIHSQAISVTASTAAGTLNTFDLSSYSVLQDLPSATTVIFRIIPTTSASGTTWYITGGSASGTGGLLVEGYVSVGCAGATVAMQGAPVDLITTTTAQLNANISALGGGAAVTTRGFEYATNTGLTSPSIISTSGTYGTGNFSQSNSVALSSNTTYFYRGFVTNNCSNPVTAYSATSSYPSFTTLPDAPSASAGTLVLQTSFQANWAAPSGSASLTYKLDVATDNLFSNMVSGFSDLSVSALFKSVTGLSASTPYYYRVRAVNSQGTSVSSSTIPVTTPANSPVISVTGNAHNSTYNFASTAWGATTDKTFTITNTGTANLTISAVTPSGSGFSIVGTTFSSPVSGPSGSTTFTVRFSPVSVASYTGTVVITNNDVTTGSGSYTINLAGAGTANSLTTLAESGSSYTANIPYASYQGISGGAIAGFVPVLSLVLTDGGASNDADDLSTLLSGAEFSVKNPSGTDVSSMIRSAVISNPGGTSIVGYGTVSGGKIVFTGLSGSFVTAADNGIRNLKLSVSFAGTVTDQTKFIYKVTSVTATGSQFAATDGGGATSDVSDANNNNRIKVTATTLRFATQPPATPQINSGFALAVEAVDALLNRDLTSTPSVSLNVNTGSGAVSSALSGTTVTLLAGYKAWTDVAYNTAETGVKIGTSNTGSLANAVSNSFNALNFTGKLWVGPNGGSWNTAANWSPSGIPTNSDPVLLDNSYVSGSYTINMAYSATCSVKTLQVGYSGSLNTIKLKITGGSDGNTNLFVNGSSGTGLVIEDGGVVIDSSTAGTSTGWGIKFVSSATTWLVNGTGKFKFAHTAGNWPSPASGTVIPVFSNTSTMEIFGTASSAMNSTGLGAITSFGNLTFDASSTFIALYSAYSDGDVITVNGNLTVNTDLYLTNNQTEKITMNVLGNVTVATGGYFVGSSGTGDPGKITVAGNVTTTGSGYIAAIESGNSTGYTGAFYIGGNFSGYYFGGDDDTLVFMGGANSISTINGNVGNTSAFRNIKFRKSVQLLSDLAATGGAITLDAGKTLDFNSFNITGNSTFTMSGSSTIKVTDAAGVVSSGTTTGNIRTSGTRTFSTSGNYHYSGSSPQQIGDFYQTGSSLSAFTGSIIIDNAAGVTMNNNGQTNNGTGFGINSPGGLEIRQGTLTESSTLFFRNGSGSNGTLTMSGGTYLVVAPGTTLTLPRLASTYSISGGTIQFSGTGDFVLRGSRSYNNLTFGNSGTVTLSSAVANVSSISITAAACTVNAESNSFGSHSVTGSGNTNFSMSAGVYRSSKASTVPEAAGTYSITGGTVELYGSLAVSNQQTLRGGVTYYNVILNADAANTTSANVVQGSGTVSIATGGKLTVNSPAIYYMSSSAILDGAGAFELISGAGLYYGSASGITSGGAVGNIRNTGTRTFSSGANYGFVGGVDMVTGSGLPSSVASLLMSKTASNNVVELTNSVTVAGLTSLSVGSMLNNGKIITAKNDVSTTASGSHSGTGYISLAGKDTPFSISGAGAFGNVEMNDADGAVVSGNITLSDLMLTAGTFDASGITLTLSSISGTSSKLSVTAATSLMFSGGSSPVTVPGHISTLSGLGINNSQGLSLAGNLAVTGTLSLTSGNVNPGSFTLTLGTSSANATVTGAGTGSYINLTTGGILKQFVNATGSYVFPVGNASYTPATINLVSGSRSAGSYFTAGMTEAASSGLASRVASNPVYLKRTWTIEPSGISAYTYNVTLKFADADVNSGSEYKQYIRPCKYSGGVFSEATETGSGAGQYQADYTSNNMTWYGLTTFSDFGGKGGPNPLPVTLLSFNGRIMNGTAVLNWVTANEEQNHGFEIEKSENGKDFASVGFVAGHGTTHIQQVYSFNDGMFSEHAYYRLRQRDNNGKSVVSHVIYLSDKSTAFYAEPVSNPVTDVVRINISGSTGTDATMNISDMLGRVIYTAERKLEQGNSIEEVQLPLNITPGTYIYEVSEAGRIQRFRFIKE